MDKGN